MKRKPKPRPLEPKAPPHVVATPEATKDPLFALQLRAALVGILNGGKK